MTETATTPVAPWWRWIMIPLGLALGLGAGFWFLYDPAPSADELFQQYFSPHHMPVLYVDGGKVGHWNDAAKAYQEGNFTAALSSLDTAEKEEEMSLGAIRFYRGQCLLAQGNPAVAEAVFAEVFTVPESPHEATRWYLALTYLKLGEREKCRDLLWEIEGEGAYKAGTATQLLREMD